MNSSTENCGSSLGQAIGDLAQREALGEGDLEERLLRWCAQASENVADVIARRQAVVAGSDGEPTVIGDVVLEEAGILDDPLVLQPSAERIEVLAFGDHELDGAADVTGSVGLADVPPAVGPGSDDQHVGERQRPVADPLGDTRLTAELARPR